MILLCRMEQGQIASWSEVDKMDRVRRAHDQRHVNILAAQTSKNHKKNLIPFSIRLQAHLLKNK